MPLVEHLRELRSRLVKATLAIVIGIVIGWMYYDAVFAWLSAPFEDVVNEARAQGRDITLALTGVADPFVLQLQVSALTGLLLSSPVWLYQLWRFVTPGLKRHERRWAIGFVVMRFSPAVVARIGAKSSCFRYRRWRDNPARPD